MRIELLGGFRVSADGQALAEHVWRRRAAAAVVQRLALAPGYAMHREQLAEDLWPAAEPGAAANNLRQALHVARRCLAPLGLDPAALLVTRRERIQLYPTAALVTDVAEFVAAAQLAQHADDPVACWTAIERYTGPLLPGVPYAEWATAPREALAAQHMALLARAARLHEARDEPERAIAALRRMLAAEPTDEGACARLMRLYAATGRPALALRHYDQLAQALARELDAQPTEDLTALRRAIAQPAPPTSSPPPALPTALTSLIGREADVAGVSALLDGARLVTVTGPGGCGKTRLAIEVARSIGPAFAGRVQLLELAPLSSAAPLVDALATALQLREAAGTTLRDQIVERLRAAPTLLVLDNCEHLLRAVADLTRWLLAACPSVRMLCTSRAPLGVAGEARWPLAPLATPSSADALDQLGESPAVRLFVERVRELRPAFRVTADNGPAVAAICRGLDGLPLALELAAARANVLAPAQIAARLDDSLRLLAGGGADLPARHRALRATLAWSEQLLAPAERALFHQLAVFRGGAALAAVETIRELGGSTPEDTLDVLTGLVDQSLAQAGEHAHELRFSLLEPVRQYAWEQLVQSGALDAAQARHAAWCAHVAETAQTALGGPEQAAWLERLETEHDNVRAALEWALARDGALALRLVAALTGFWELRGHVAEGRAWLTRALALDDAPPALQARALQGAGTLAWRQGDYIQAAELHARSLEAFQRLGDEREVARELINLGAQALNLEDYRAAEAHLSAALRLAEALDDDTLRAMALINLGLAAQGRGDDAQSAARFDDALVVARRLDNAHFVAVALQNVGELAHRRGDDERALALHRESLALAVELDARVHTAFCLEEIGAIYADRGAAERAARLFGAAEALRVATHAPPGGVYRAQLYDPAVGAMRVALGARAFAAAWSAGRQLPLADAVREALESPAAATSPLSPRERDIAVLVAQGWTNRQIATALGIGERTVDTHVRHILHKLGVHSRRAVAERLRADLADGA